MPTKESFGISLHGVSKNYKSRDSKVKEDFKIIYEEVICINKMIAGQDPKKILTPLEFRLYCHILRSSNNGKKTRKSEGYCYESLESIGEYCGGKRKSSSKKKDKPILMSKNTVHKGLLDLQEKKIILLELLEQHNDKTRKPYEKIYKKTIKKSIAGIDSLDQLYIDRELDEYGFTPSEFRVYFHIVFKYFYGIDRDNEFVILKIKEDSEKLKGVSPRSLQEKLRILELVNVIEPQTHIYATNSPIPYKVNTMNLWKDAIPHLIRARDHQY